MPIVPIRDLAKYGVIADVDAFNLPPQAFSMAVNARFADGSIQRGPLLRTVNPLALDYPRFVTTYEPAAVSASLMVAYRDGTVSQFSGGAEADVSITGYMPTNSEAKFTATVLSDVVYVNREDRVPWALKPSDSEFQELDNWDADWTCKLLRSCGGALVALNVTKGAVAYPTMVKTSEFAESGDVPSDWDETDPTNNCTENVLAEMVGEINDASLLGDVLCIYSRNETWFMTPDSSNNVFNYRRASFRAGSISANCSIEVDGYQYVIGPNDIWRHDGVQKESIADGRVRKFVFRDLNTTQAHRCFVKHNVYLNELYFHYVSNDSYCHFSQEDGAGCNRVAVYNLTNGTWTFYDVPYVFGADSIEASSAVLTYATATLTYDEVSSSYSDLNDTSKKSLVYAAGVSDDLAAVLYALDLDGPDSLVNLPPALDAIGPVRLYRDGIDVDELNAELRGMKLIASIYPQGRLADSDQLMSFSFGASDGFNLPVTYTDPQTYNGADLYKLDFNTAGRYLAMNVTYDAIKWFSLTGFDLDLEIIADR